MNDLYIGGAWAPSASGATSQTLNPYDASVLATVAEASAADVGRAVAAARAAFDDGPWPRTPAASRGKALCRARRAAAARPRVAGQDREPGHRQDARRGPRRR